MALHKKEVENVVVSTMKTDLDQIPYLKKSIKTLKEENEYLKLVCLQLPMTFLVIGVFWFIVPNIFFFHTGTHKRTCFYWRKN